MAIYIPRLPFEIMAELVARVVSVSRDLSDLSEGGVLGTLMGSVAEEIGAVERRIQEFVDAFYFRGTGVNLDRRLNDFPAGFPKRRQSTPAVGGAFRVTRSLSTGTTTVAARAMLVSVSTSPTTQYTNVSAFTIDPGSYTAVSIAFVALSPGAAGNILQVGAVDTISRKPNEVIECTNTQPLLGGSDKERDPELRQRAERWVGSLALTQNEALEAIALNFQASDGVVLRHARMWNDPDQRGYSELVVSDGSDMIGYTRPAETYSGQLTTLIGTGSRYTFTVDGPVATPPVLTTAGQVRPRSSYRLQHERNVIYLNKAPQFTVTPGDAWSVGGHEVYTGIIAELQRYINVVCVAAGVTVRVVAPTSQAIALTYNMVSVSGSDLNALRTQLNQAIVAYVAGLPPGAPLIIYQMTRAIAPLSVAQGVVNLTFDQSDLYPGSPRHKLTLRLSDVTGR